MSTSPPPAYPPHARTYRYDEVDREFLAERVAEFRDQVERRLAGALTEDEFRPLRLMNGLYLQLHAYMLRIAIPYGIANATQLRQLADDRRAAGTAATAISPRAQNIQFNWPKLQDVPDILRALCRGRDALPSRPAAIASATSPPTNMPAPPPTRWRTRGPVPRSCANGRRCIRNSPGCRASSRSPSRARRRTARRSRSTTSACRLKRNAGGEIGFEVWSAAAWAAPRCSARSIRDFLPEDELLAYLEAIMRVYNRYGRRDNMHKARIKILVHELGIEEFRAQVEAEFGRDLPRRDRPAGRRDLDADRGAISRRRAFDRAAGDRDAYDQALHGRSPTSPPGSKHNVARAQGRRAMPSSPSR